MLVLSRKKNESIVINDDITIVVVEIRGDKVRLGIEAPKEVPVHRREVWAKLHPPPGQGSGGSTGAGKEEEPGTDDAAGDEQSGKAGANTEATGAGEHEAA